MDGFFGGLLTVLSWPYVLFFPIGSILGMLVGSIPGISTSMAIALLAPLTFFMDPVPGLILLFSVYVASTHAGSISGTLIGTPGTPPAAATLLDGFPLSKKGYPRKALQIDLYSSVVGGLMSGLLLIFASVPLANVAIRFGPPEFFAVIVFGLTMIAGISGETLTKGLIAAVLGFLFSTIGTDPISATRRFTFGILELTGGLELVPVLIGILAMSEVLGHILRTTGVHQRIIDLSGGFKRDDRLTMAEFLRCMPVITKSGLIGALVGVIPGISGSVAAFLAYSEAKRSSKHPERFGTGELEGIAAPEAANNGSTGATLIPLLTLGIPGGSIAAILLGPLMVHGLVPGPFLFQNHPHFVWSLFAAFIVANLVMLVVGYFYIYAASSVVLVRASLLIPCILLFCAIGTYAIRGQMFDVWTMFIFGILGYLMKTRGLPTATFIVGFILGPMLEASLQRSLLLGRGQFSYFLTRPIAMAILGFTVLFSILIAMRGVKERKRRKNAAV